MTRMTLVAAAVLGCMATTVMAQESPTSSVTLYGLADAGINHVSGLKQGSVTQLASGIMEGSRWGVKGNEDLGGGMRAIFTLESRVELDTGSVSNTAASGTQLPDRASSPAALGLPTNALFTSLVAGAANSIGGSIGVNHIEKNMFDRQAFVGLITPVGAITAGRQYTPGYLASAAFDSMHTESSLALGQLVSVPASFTLRVSNSLQYGIKAGGVTAAAMYAMGETGNNNAANRLLGVMAIYKNDQFSFGGGYNTKKNELGQKSLTNAVLGASVEVGPGTLSTLYATIKDDNPSGLSTIAAGLTPGATQALIAQGLSPAAAAATAAAAGTAVQNAFINAFKQNSNLIHIGYRLTMGPHTTTVAYNTMNDKTAANADRSSYGVAYTYALSKRTDVSAVLTRFNNKNTSQIAPGGNGFLGGVTASAGTDSTNVAFGIRHRF